MLLTYRAVCYSVKSSPSGDARELLHSASGLVAPGDMLAIMGPSGSGKTTLMDVLGGRVEASKVSGEVLYNTRKYSPALKRQLAYCTQDDVLFGALTCRENIWYSARLRLPGVHTAEQVNTVVSSTLTSLGLDRVADCYIGTPFHRGISGGERRRVSVAVELVTQPGLLFLDEPTSGLDSAAAYFLIKDLGKYAKGTRPSDAKAIVSVIHQPSSLVFNAFSKLHLLANGRTVYHGLRNNAVDYFSKCDLPAPANMNPAEHYLNCISMDFVEDLQTDSSRVEFLSAFAKSAEADLLAQEICNITQGVRNAGAAQVQLPVYKQTWHVTSRQLLHSRRDISMFWVRLAMYSAMGLLMGLVWYDTEEDAVSEENRISAYFFSCAFLCFMSVAAVPAILDQRKVIVRDQQAGAYPEEVFVLAHFIITVPFLFAIAICFSLIALPMMRLRTAVEDNLGFVVVLWMALMAAEGMVLAVSVCLPNFIAALTTASFLNGFFMIVQGYFVRKPQIPEFLAWAHYLSYQKYSLEAMMDQGFTNLSLKCYGYGTDATSCTGCSSYVPYAVEEGDADFCKFGGEQVLERLGYEDVHWKESLAYLAIIVGMFWGLFYLGVKFMLGFQADWFSHGFKVLGASAPSKNVEHVLL